ATREKVRAFINAASTKEIVYVRGTTEAINLVAYSWGRKNIKQGDLIVLTILDHHSNIVPWQILAAEKGAQIEYVDIDEKGELLEAMDPFMAGGDMIKTVRIEGTTYHDLPWKFEAGTQAIAEVIGLGAAVDYLSGLGMDAVRAHELEITEYAYESLSDIDGLTLYGPPPSRRAGVISFALEGIHPHDLATIADRDQVCLRAGHHCAMP